MKLNFNQPFKDMHGNPHLEGGKPAIIGKHLGFQLYNANDKLWPMKPEEKYMAYCLSVKIGNAEGEVEISPEEAQLIDRVASRTLTAGAYGNIKDLLNNA